MKITRNGTQASKTGPQTGSPVKRESTRCSMPINRHELPVRASLSNLPPARRGIRIHSARL